MKHRYSPFIMIWILLFFLPATSGAAASDLKLLFFYQNGCHWCDRMEELLHEPDMKRLLSRHAEMIRINVLGREKALGFGRAGRDVAREFRVYGTPTIIFVGTGEEVLLRIPGAVTKKDFRDLVCRYIPEIQGECHGKVGAL